MYSFSFLNIKKFVWRKPNTELQQRNIHTTVKHGGGNVMLWGCMGYNGVGNIAFIKESMKAEKYIDILRNNLSESAKKLCLNRTYYFQQDNVPKHTAKKTKEWLLYNVPKQLITPPQSPDINPIENLWHLLNIEIRKRKISNKTDLQRIILQEWPKISKEITKKLVESMPKRLQAIIDAKGMHTKY
ncbi:Transposable element Tcb2 transposase [Anthophora quadrimaculata]